MRWRYIDTHAHVNMNAFKDDWKEAVARAHEAEVAMINVGTQADTSRRAVEIAEAYDSGVYAIVGLHPLHTSASYHDEKELGENMKGFTSRGEVFDAHVYRELAKHKKVVAIGECGLDYYRLEKGAREKQEAAFIAHIELANECGLPLMIHARGAQGNQESAAGHAGSGDVYDDIHALLKHYAKVRGNIHFYAGSWQQAKRFFDIGFSVSFTGVVTFANDYDDVVRNAPLDMIHAETDCPYVAPVPHRGKRCEPHMVIEVYRKIAEMRGEDNEVVRRTLRANAQRLFGV